MSSDYWQELWREQPLPVALADRQRLLEQVQDVQTEWEREWDAMDRSTFWLLALPAVKLPAVLFFGDKLDWTLRFLFVASVSLVALTAVFRRRRLALERDFGHTLVERIALGQALLRQRIRLDDLTIWGLPCLAAAIGGLSYEMTRGSLWTAVAVGSVALVGFGWVLHWDWRLRRERLEEKLSHYRSLQAELEPEPK